MRVLCGDFTAFQAVECLHIANNLQRIATHGGVVSRNIWPDQLIGGNEESVPNAIFSVETLHTPQHCVTPEHSSVTQQGCFPLRGDGNPWRNERLTG